MKKIHLLAFLFSAFLLGACENNIDDLSGVYDFPRYQFDQATVEPTVKLQKGIKALNMVMTDDAQNVLNLTIGTPEWILPAGTYNAVSEVTTGKQFSATVKSAEGTTTITGGSLEVNLYGETYIITGLMQAGEQTVKCTYRGPLSFEVGEDDPVASGYLANVSISALTVMDWSTWQQVVIPGMSSYIISISDPDGNDAARLEVVNTEGLSAEGLAGTYTIKGSPTEPWLIANGYAMPEYSAFGGSYYIAEGKKHYLAENGQVVISTVTGMEGDTLFNFSATGIASQLEDGSASTVSFNIKFATFLESTGMKLELSMNSTEMSCEVKYSVYLPQNFDWSGNTKYPVLYMLHGAWGDQNDWLDKGYMGAFLSQYMKAGGNPMIIVCPQGSIDGVDLFYSNNYNGSGKNYETFFFNEFMPTVENQLPIKQERDARMIAGLSMGGYGTLYYSLIHPELFCYAYACSPAIVLGDANNLWMYPVPDNMPGVTIEIGTEDYLYEQAAPYAGYALGGRCEYIERPGAHDWPFWVACAPKIIAKAGAQFAHLWYE